MESKGFSDIFRKNLKGSEREKVNFFAQKETKIFLTYLYLSDSLSLSLSLNARDVKHSS